MSAFYGPIKSIWWTKSFTGFCKVGCIWIFSKIYNFYSKLSKWLHFGLWRTLEQTRLSKHSYKKYSVPTDWDSQKFYLTLLWMRYLCWEIKQITIKNLRDLDSHFPKIVDAKDRALQGSCIARIVHCRLETIIYKGPQLWQLLPGKIRKVAL